MKQPEPAGSDAFFPLSQRRRALAALALAAAGHALIALLAIRYGHHRPYFPPAAAPGILHAALIAEVSAPPAAEPLPPLPDLAPQLAVPPLQAASDPPPAPALAQPPAAAPATGAEPSFQERYYRTGEVDQPANPLSEWRIDTSRLPPDERHRAAVAVWVDSSGKITRMEIARLDPDNDEAREALRDLVETAMEPALLGGARVGNMRLIEVVFSRRGR